MRKLFACVLVFASVSAKAASELEVQVLTAVVANASAIVLNDPATEQPYPQNEQLPARLAQALLQNYAQMGEYGGDLSNVGVSCDESDYAPVPNAIAYNCQVYIASGGFRKNGDSFTGPNGQGSVSFWIEVIKPWDPSKKIKIKTTSAVVEIAE